MKTKKNVLNIFIILTVILFSSCQETQLDKMNNNIVAPQTETDIHPEHDPAIPTGDEVLSMYLEAETLLFTYEISNPPPGLFFKDTTWGIGMGSNGKKYMYYNDEIIDTFAYITYHSPGGLPPNVGGGWAGQNFYIAVQSQEYFQYSGWKWYWYKITNANRNGVINPITKVASLSNTNGVIEFGNNYITTAKKIGDDVIFYGANYWHSQTYSFHTGNIFYNFYRTRNTPSSTEWIWQNFP